MPGIGLGGPCRRGHDRWDYEDEEIQVAGMATRRVPQDTENPGIGVNLSTPQSACPGAHVPKQTIQR